MKNTLHTRICLQDAYRYFNRQLFGNNLPDANVYLEERNSKSLSMHKFIKIASRKQRDDSENIFSFNQSHQIALSPHLFFQNSLKMVFSFFVREMVKIWTYENGTGSRNGYFNQSWADKMESLGIIPSDTAKPGGNKTGQNLNHYLETGGKYELSYLLMHEELKARLLQITIPVPESNVIKSAKVKRKNKQKYSCPSCHANVWGKASLFILCGACNIQMIQLTD